VAKQPIGGIKMKTKLITILTYGSHVYFKKGCEWYILITKQQNNSRLSDLKQLLKLKAFPRFSREV
jgi:hypothetical protein